MFSEISQNSQEKRAGELQAILLKKRLWHRYFPVNFVKFLRKPFLRNTSGRLLLYFTICYLFLNSIKVLIRFWSIFKGATKLHFTYYFCVWSLLFFNISVSKLAFPTNYFGKVVFRFCVLDEFSVYSEIWILCRIYEIIRFRIIAFIESLFIWVPSGHLLFCSSFIKTVSLCKNINNQWYCKNSDLTNVCK